MIYKLTKDATIDQLEAAGLGPNYATRDYALFYQVLRERDKKKEF